MLSEKLQETCAALDTGKSKAEEEQCHRLKLESKIKELDEKLHSESIVSYSAWIQYYHGVSRLYK